jgi:multiple sugar transport system ATP-binding protein
MTEVALHDVAKRFGPVQAVADLSLTVADGEFVALLGPTGAGKTTTLRLIAGLEQPDAGQVLIGGQDVTRLQPAERDVAFVFQQYSLYPHLTVFDNLAFPLRAPSRRMAEPELRRRVEDIAALLRLSGKLRNRATRLSGGEMQRVAIGRALVRRPAIYLMDEPLSSLDAKLRADLRIELKRIHHDLGATILYVTHDQIEAMTMAGRIGVMREGALVQLGTPQQIYEDPADIYVAGRLGSPAINLLPADALPVPRLPSHAHTMGIRTEHIHVAPARDGGIGTVTRVEHLGDQSHLHLEAGGHRLVTLVEAHTRLAPGDRVDLAIEDPLFFDADGRRVRLEQPAARPLETAPCK